MTRLPLVLAVAAMTAFAGGCTVAPGAGLARDLDRLATSVNRRDEKLTALIGDLSVAGRVLADERERLRAFLGALAALVREGDTVVTAYREKLPGTLAEASELVMTLKANSASVARGIVQLARSIDVVIESWDREAGAVTVRAQLTAMARGKNQLKAVTDLLGKDLINAPSLSYNGQAVAHVWVAGFLPAPEGQAPPDPARELRRLLAPWTGGTP